MSDSYYYYRCPCPSTECNGSVCRYPEILPPVATSFNPPSCSFFPQERKLLSYAPNTPKIQPDPRTITKHVPQPARWGAPFGSIPERQVSKPEITPRTISDSARVNSPAQLNRPTTTTTTSSEHQPNTKPPNRTRRVRTAFTPFQLLCLETSFDKNHYVVGSERKQLASYLKLSETQVKVWFQNRRTKWKRQSLEGRVDMNKDPLTP